MWLQKIISYGRLIKFSHTIFALPFALAAVVLAHHRRPVTMWTLFWIVVAMAAARSAAMGFNRVADYEYDRRNPRTASRPLTSGEIDLRSAILFIAASSCIFIGASAALGKLCLALSIPVLLVLFGYSLTKRFTAHSHLVLGFAIGLAPAGAWVAVTGRLNPGILLLSAALMTYIAGFDILYSCQDIEFDQREKLFSLPACRGIVKAMRISSILHVMSLCFLLSLCFVFHLGMIYLTFLVVIAVLFFLEHRMVSPDNLDKINIAFFHMNSVISLLLFIGVLTDIAVNGQ